MNATLLARAREVVSETPLLVNMVRQRVSQLLRGHRPLVVVPLSMGWGDVALVEIAAGKIVSERKIRVEPQAVPAAILPFPLSPATKDTAAA